MYHVTFAGETNYGIGIVYHILIPYRISILFKLSTSITPQAKETKASKIKKDQKTLKKYVYFHISQAHHTQTRNN